MLKKIICFLTVITILFSLAACKPVETTTIQNTPRIIWRTRPPTPTVSAEPTSTPTPKAIVKKTVQAPVATVIVNPVVTPVPGPEWVPDFPAKPATLVNLKLLSNSPDALNITLDQEYVKIFEDAFNVKITLIDAAALPNLKTAAELPDIIPAQIGSQQYDYLKDNNLIREIPDSILSKYPALKTMADTHDATVAFKNLDSGKLFDMPRLQAYPVNRNYDTTSLAVRKDWMAKVGITAPDTIAGLTDLFDKFTNNDPDGNGIADTYGIAGNLEAAYFTPFTGTRLLDWVKESDGKYVPTFMSSKMDAPLKYYTDLFANNLISKSFANSGTDAASVFNRPYKAGLLPVDSETNKLFVSLSPNFKFKGANFDGTKGAITNGVNTYTTKASDILGGDIPNTPTPEPTPTPFVPTPTVDPSITPEPRTPKPTRTPLPTPVPTPTPLVTVAPTAVPTPTPIPLLPSDFAFQSADTLIGDVIELLPPLKLTADSQALVPYVPSTDCTLFNSGLSDEQLDRILMMYNYILTGKGSDIVTYGVYDTDWYALDNVAFLKNDKDMTGAKKYSWDLYECQDIFTYASFSPKPFTPVYSKGDATLGQMSAKQDTLFSASNKVMSDTTVIKSIMINYIANKTINDAINAIYKGYDDALAVYNAGGTKQAYDAAVEAAKTSAATLTFNQLSRNYKYGAEMDLIDATTDLSNATDDLNADPTNTALINAKNAAQAVYDAAVIADTAAKAVVDAAKLVADAPVVAAKAADDLAYKPVKAAATTKTNDPLLYANLFSDSKVMYWAGKDIVGAKTSDKVLAKYSSGTKARFLKDFKLQGIIDKVNASVKTNKYFN